MKDIAIYGAGGFGREVACMLAQINAITPTWNFVGFFDDGKDKGEHIVDYGLCLGNWKDLNEWPSPLSIAVCIGKPSTSKMIVDRIVNDKISFPNLIHPDFIPSKSSSIQLGYGNIIKGGCTATCDIKLGNFNVLNGFIHLGHDVTIGDFNGFMPGTTISGEVSIGNLNLFGVNSIVIQQIKIGNEITLSPGSVLLTKPKDGHIYMGNPAKKIKF